jgi:V8-like Glu-specific endopeptidase
MEKLILAIILMSVSLVTTASTKVIYGDDNRVDVYKSTNADFVELSKSTAAMIPNASIKKAFGSKTYKIKAKSLESRGICKTERFAKQPSAANCSGFLVGDKYLVTAGHCIRRKSDCKGSHWVFGYKMKNATEANLEIEEENVYRCKKIISQSLNSSNKDDYALIELDRVAQNIRPLTFRKSGKIAEGEAIVVIGHPSGLPTKIADGANVRKLSGKYFSANLDTYGGNSGSAVFNVATGLVEGILVRGETDYVRRGGCSQSNTIGNNSGRGEDVTFITNIEELQNL